MPSSLGATSSKRRSNGRIKIEPYFANALGKRSDAMDSVRTGIADLAEAPFSSNPGAFPFHSQIFFRRQPQYGSRQCL